MSLFKFTSTTIAKDILRKCAIRFTPPNEFNDPFEVSPHFFDILGKDFLQKTIKYSSREKLIEQIKFSAPETYMKLPIEVSSLILYNDFLNNIINFADTPQFVEIADLFFSIGSAAVSDGLSNAFQKTSSDIFGILCLGGRFDCELMWAHYANSHKGVAIVFFEDNEFFHQKSLDAENIRFGRKVNYTNQRPVFSDLYEKALRHEVMDDFLTKMYFTKSDAWSYEEEFRFIRPLLEADEVIVNNGMNIHLFKFTPDCLQGVIFGARCSQIDQNEILSILESIHPNTSKSLCLKMKIDECEYKLSLGHLD